MTIVFDVIGTLFSLNQVRRVLLDLSIREELLEIWFLRLLHSAASCTMLGNYQPFGKLMPATLRQSLTVHGYDGNLTAKILPAFNDLQLWEDAKSCLNELKQQNYQLIALTNGSKENTVHLMNQASILEHFDEIFSCDDIKACKPHPTPYKRVLNQLNIPPEEAYMVAAHAWDIMGAHAVGMQTIWISQLESIWPFSGNPPGEALSNLEQVKKFFDKSM